MKILKPAWVHHDGHPIFCIDIHPDDTRFVTGGQGNDSVGRIVIWNLKPLLSIRRDQQENNCPLSQESVDSAGIPKLLCQLDHHNACVNAVRWCHSGRYLASGGDDRLIIIWRLTAKTNPNAFSRNSQPLQNCGFGKTAYETWKPVSTLRSHTGDILDLSWSSDDKYLASASVDNTVLIWDANKFPSVIAELKGHTSLVKGVTWDPVGKYIASQSDDKTLKIWRTSDWLEEHTVEDPFHECGGTTHVLRLDWSPDGMYLVSAHAMNGGGPTAQIVERDGWRTDKDFVGHRKAVVCVRFNSNILTQKSSKTCLVALGSRDRSISVWSTHLKRPVIVLRDVFTNSVMDLAWSSCGTIMMACSWDGTVVLQQFSTVEIGVPLTTDEKNSLHERVYGKNTKSTNSSSQIIQNIEVFMARRTQDEKPPEAEDTVASGASNPNVKKPPNDFELMDTSNPPNIPRGPDKQIETRTPDGKRRITPKFLPNLDASLLTVPCGTTTTTIFQNTDHSSQSNLRDNMVSGIDDVMIGGAEDPVTAPETSAVPPPTVVDDSRSQHSIPPPAFAAANETPEIVEVNGHAHPEPSSSQTVIKADDQPEPQATRLGQINGELELAKKPVELPAPLSATIKRKLSEDGAKVPKPVKKQQKLVPEIIQDSPFVQPPRPIPGTSAAAVSTPKPHPPPPVTHHSTPTHAPARRKLNPMKIQDILTLRVNKKPDIRYTLEVENKISGGRRCNFLRCQHESQSSDTSATPYLPDLYWCIQTEAPICGVSGDGTRIVTVCEDATVHVLDLKGRYAFPPLVVSSVPSKMAHNGPFLLVVTTKATMHVWNIHTKKSVKTESLMPLINQPGQGQGVMEGKLVDIVYVSVSSTGVPRLILSNGKSFMYNRDMGTWMVMSDPTATASSAARGDILNFLQFDPLCKRTGVISQVKLRLATATELERTEDVREWIIVLAKSLAAQGLRSELHQLCEDLLGPTHSSAGGTGSSWSPTIVGVNKRHVLKLILTTFAKDLAWQDFYSEFQDLLELQEEMQTCEKFAEVVSMEVTPTAPGNANGEGGMSVSGSA